MTMRFGGKLYLSKQSFIAEVAFGVFKAVVLSGIVLATLYPFWNTLVISFNQAIDTTRGGHLSLAPHLVDT